MPVVSSHKDPENLTLTIVSEHAADVDRVWQIWEDPRQLEQWWGPPTWPATFEEHSLVPGGRSRYYMTGPEGEKAGGWWTILTVDPPRSFEFEDGFADEGEATPTTDTTRAVVTLEPVDSRTRMTIVTTFASLEHLELLAQMGMEEGMREAMGQIDGVLAG
ncbi:SRPBCC family protein [Sanguibacter keddieii]|uniref:SRPBCC family protein n=1 Tax=Sanguibacter keddieii TaxID=60920 RepID=UPI0005A6DDEE|nr:SRPBCC domain-containing protein [Sanguibacter keddieii]